MHLTMDYKDPRQADFDELAREINGKDLKTGKQLATFATLTDDGINDVGRLDLRGELYGQRATSEAPRWRCRSSEKRSDRDGLLSELVVELAVNRRISTIVRRPISMEIAWDPKRPGITWNGAKWVGDVPDYPPTMSPHDPKAWLPFIMNGEGTGASSRIRCVDGPFPEHYEPMESPVQERSPSESFKIIRSCFFTIKQGGPQSLWDERQLSDYRNDVSSDRARALSDAASAIARRSCNPNRSSRCRRVSRREGHR